MDTKKRLLITYLPLIIGFITAETIVYLGRDNNMANYIGLIIALLTVAGSILANFFQYKPANKKSRLNFKKIENFIQIEHWASKEDHHTSADLKIEVID